MKRSAVFSSINHLLQVRIQKFLFGWGGGGGGGGGGGAVQTLVQKGLLNFFLWQITFLPQTPHIPLPLAAVARYNSMTPYLLRMHP